ncbi:MAG: hypothetical protein KAJ92_07825, partial [Gammaproteobacteria bacterium]|nr:hypothetical protein [Gammaproteobacteria bacterium]
MKTISTFCLLLCFTLFSPGCTEQVPHEFKRTILKFGTLIDITLYDVKPSLAEKALKQIEANFNQYHADWTSWQDSPLTRANQKLANGQSTQVHP